MTAIATENCQFLFRDTFWINAAPKQENKKKTGRSSESPVINMYYRTDAKYVFFFFLTVDL